MSMEHGADFDWCNYEDKLAMIGVKDCPRRLQSWVNLDARSMPMATRRLSAHNLSAMGVGVRESSMSGVWTVRVCGLGCLAWFDLGPGWSWVVLGGDPGW